jgi:hypothetical protein
MIISAWKKYIVRTAFVMSAWMCVTSVSYFYIIAFDFCSLWASAYDDYLRRNVRPFPSRMKAGIPGEMRGYQLQGLNWMVKLCTITV